MKRERIEKALNRAIVHVLRQQHAGKHEQDRIDAKAWEVEFADVVKYLREKDLANKNARKKPS